MYAYRNVHTNAHMRAYYTLCMHMCMYVDKQTTAAGQTDCQSLSQSVTQPTVAALVWEILKK